MPLTPFIRCPLWLFPLPPAADFLLTLEWPWARIGPTAITWTAPPSHRRPPLSTVLARLSVPRVDGVSVLRVAAPLTTSCGWPG
ncbi:hypothetical protein GCM10020220_036460 [Nonomuraea rubra]